MPAYATKKRTIVIVDGRLVRYRECSWDMSRPVDEIDGTSVTQPTLTYTDRQGKHHTVYIRYAGHEWRRGRLVARFTTDVEATRRYWRPEPVLVVRRG